ncbi:MAG: ArsC family reductase [Pseudomonadota bacterium]|nr:ArsC family reductase [Pseudomonadota bacterium]MDO7667781.1 ArsC family reductase [Pseudomonadota bacterium]MDO7710347.1 ArsC family reductase [Pseudomonadota bacterium]
MTTVYGIKNCDTVKKSRRWLEANGVAFQFHDFRDDGIDEKTIQFWLQSVSWETLLNKRSTTWRQVDQTQRDTINKESAIGLMLAFPSIIKRPVLVNNDTILVGFDEVHYKSLL